MSDPSNRPTDDEQRRDELVAYLDGELDAPAAEAIERQLAEDGALRTEMQELERVWDSLAELPHEPVGESFVKTTVKMVALAAEEEVKTRRAALPRQKAVRRFAASGTMVACVLAGFLIALAIWSDPDDELVADLPVVENLDLYLQAESLDFVSQLHEQDIRWNGVDGSVLVTYFVETPEERNPTARREKIANYSENEKYELKNRYDRFTKLSESEQQRIRALHEAIVSAPNGEALLQTLAQYQNWLSNEVSAGERADLVAIEEVGARVTEIDRRVKWQSQHQRPPWKKLMEESQARLDKMLSREDQEVVSRWGKDKMRLMRNAEIRRRQAEKTKGNGDRSNRSNWEKNSRSNPRSNQRRRGGWFGFQLQEEDLASLKPKLSKVAQEKLDAAGAAAKQTMLLGTWVRLTAGIDIQKKMISRHGIPVDDEELMAFFSSDKLTSQQRQQLMNLPKDEMRQRLFQLYAKLELGIDAPNLRRRGEGPPPPPGGPRGRRGGRHDEDYRRGRDHNRPGRPSTGRQGNGRPGTGRPSAGPPSSGRIGSERSDPDLSGSKKMDLESGSRKKSGPGTGKKREQNASKKPKESANR